MAALRFLLLAGVLPACAFFLGGKQIGIIEVPQAVLVSAVLAALFLLMWAVWRKIAAFLRSWLLGLALTAVDAWLIVTAAQVVQNSYHVEGFLWALIPAAAVNLIRVLFGKKE